MADVKWIKFYVSILTSPKIKRVRRMPDGNTVALIWAFLLAQAGESNKEGALYFTDEIPYTPEEFAMQYDFEVDTVRLAVATFEKFGMIEVFDGIIYIKNWEEYQNTGGLEKMREQNRIRQARFKQKILEEKQSNVTVTLPVTQSNATDIEEEIEIDKDINKSIPDDKPSSRTQKHKHGQYNHVMLKDEEVEKLQSEYGQSLTDQAITFLDEYIEMKGYKAKSHYLCIRKWVVDAVKEREKKQPQQPKQNKFNQFPQRSYSEQDMNDLEKKLLQKGL